MHRSRTVEVGEGVVRSSEQGSKLTERPLDRATGDLAPSCRHEMSEREHLVVQRLGQLLVAGPRHDLGEHRHPICPAVVVRQRLLAASHDLDGESVRFIRPSGLEAGKGKDAAEQSVSRIQRARLDEIVLELGKATLLSAQGAAARAGARRPHPTTVPSGPRRTSARLASRPRRAFPRARPSRCASEPRTRDATVGGARRRSARTPRMRDALGQADPSRRCSATG